MIVDFTTGDLSVQPPRRTACKDAHECGKADPSNTLLEEYEVPMEIKRPRIAAEDAKNPPKTKSPAIWRGKETHVSCPRCNSLATRFCYFNNYNVKQPRHFCKACQRFWTNGGSIWDLPVGSGRRRKYKQKSGTNMGKHVAFCLPWPPTWFWDTWLVVHTCPHEILQRCLDDTPWNQAMKKTCFMETWFCRRGFPNKTQVNDQASKNQF